MIRAILSAVLSGILVFSCHPATTGSEGQGAQKPGCPAPPSPVWGGESRQSPMSVAAVRVDIAQGCPTKYWLKLADDGPDGDGDVAWLSVNRNVFRSCAVVNDEGDHVPNGRPYRIKVGQSGC